MHAERALITGLLDNTDYGVMGVNDDGLVVFANESAQRYFGYSGFELVGEPLHELTHHSFPDGRPYPCEQCTLRDAMLSMNTIKVRDETFFTKSGAQLPVDVTVTPMQTRGASRMSVVSFRDLTESMALDRRQQQFVSVVSHELRTPVTSIRGSLQLLDAGVLGSMPEDQENLVRLAYRNAERLNLLINDILDLERLDSGRLTLHPEELDAVLSARGTVEEMGGAAAAAGVQLRVDAPDANLPVFVDPHRLAQILVNLIGNAIKFSDEDTCVVVQIRPEGPLVRFDVEDQGRGIPEEALGRIFERFGQVEAADTRTKGGTGLGLAIAKELSVASGGSITVESTYGRGTSFTVRLPRGRGEQS